MVGRRDAGWPVLMALLLVSPPGYAMAQTGDGTPPSEEESCDGLSGRAHGLCIAYCEAQDCDSLEEDTVACQQLRKNFEKATGSSTFPCDEVVATPTSTATNTAPAATATDTPEPTVTDTPTGTPTATAAATATDTPEPTATDTAEPTVTETPTGTPTGTAAATATDTPEPTVTDTAEPTATDTAEPTVTGTPTGTAAATATDTSAPTVTDTPEPTVTSTPAATATDTGVPTATDTPEPTATASPTETAAPLCALEAGRYTITQEEGGTLQVASIGQPTGFPFPAGGMVVQDVGPGDADCVHETVVPAEGGFSAPIFCIPGLNFTVQVEQTGCGIGQIDSDGGSDYTVTEVGDTSDSSPTCNLPHAGCANGADSSQRVDITVGDGTTDTCPSGGTGNAIVAIPVETTTWLADDFTCPDADGVFDAADTLILQVPQILDFTTDVSTASWSDIDGDGCAIAGAGPASGLTRTGACIDLNAMSVTTAATGTIGSDGSPLFDLTFATLLPNSLSGPTASGGATCATPPVIDFTGLATRCIQ